MGVSIYGVEDTPTGYSHRERRNSEKEQQSVVTRRQDLAFVMYTDKDIAEVNRYSYQSMILVTTFCVGFLYKNENSHSNVVQF